MKRRACWYEIVSLYFGRHLILGYSPLHALKRAIRRRKATPIGTAVKRID